jgi:hypothetical protein
MVETVVLTTLTSFRYLNIFLVLRYALTNDHFSEIDEQEIEQVCELMSSYGISMLVLWFISRCRILTDHRRFIARSSR